MTTEVEDIRDKIRTFIQDELLRGQDIGLTDDKKLFTTRLIDSFALAELGVFIESEFDVYIPDADLTSEKLDTIAEVADRVRRDLHE